MKSINFLKVSHHQRGHLMLIIYISCLRDKHFPKRQILDSSKLKEWADGNFKFNENGR